MAKVDLSGRFKSKRVPWSDEELRLTLGYYFFIYENNTREHDYELFTNHLKALTGNDRSYGSVGVRFGNFNSVNPNKTGSGFKGGDKKCKPIWDACINKDGSPKESFILEFMHFVQTYGKSNKIYSPFLKKYKTYSKNLKKPIEIDDEEDVINTNDISESESFEKPSYKIEPKPSQTTTSTKAYQRDPLKAKKAIFNANYCCNIERDHSSFVAKSGKKYMEAHHLVPIGAQDEFENSLDVDANIVCLCPNCHRKLHYGKDIESNLKKLFSERKDLLKKSGIVITFEKLMEYYK